MQTQNEKFFTLFGKAGSNVVASAAVLMEFPPRRTSSKRSSPKHLHDTEHAALWRAA
jgi:hypothetical protein